MSTYKLVDGVLIEVNNRETPIDIDQLKARKAELEAIPEPSLQELADCGKAGMVHPFYDPQREQEINILTERISFYEAKKAELEA